MRSILTLLFVILPSAAFAHTGHGDTAGILSGFFHPMSGLDHTFAMLAVGIFAFVLGGRALYLVPLSFVLMMDAGFLLGVSGVQLPFVELAIGLSSIVIGGVAASGKSVPVAAAMALVGAFALFHGHAHGAEMPAHAAGFEYAIGFMSGTALLHLAGIGAALGIAKLAGSYGRRIARLAAGLFALGGIGILSGWL